MAHITNLKCNSSAFPITVDRKAVLTWNIAGDRQKSFNASLFAEGKEIARSGLVMSEEGLYSWAIAFKPLTKYVCRLTAYTYSGSELTQEISFMTALSLGFDALAKWIGGGQIPRDKQNPNGNGAVYLKRRFDIETLPKTSLIYYAALGLGTVYINGRKVGDSVLGADFTDYTKSVFYNAYDVSGYITKGSNCLEVVLADGWYNQTTKDEWGFYSAPWRDSPKLLLQLNLDDNRIYSDTEWQASGGSIYSSAIRLGEHYNSSLETVQEAKNAIIMQPPKGKLKCSDGVEIKECAVYQPVKITEHKGVYLLDFKENISGYVRFSLDLKKGQYIEILHGDRLDDNFRIDNKSNSQYIYNDNFTYQCDSYIAHKDGHVVHNPQFVYHGFRYIEVRGLTQPPQTDSFCAVKVRSAFERTGGFRCSDEVLNTLYDMSIAACEANYTGFPADCPHREKNGWTGDMALSAELFLYNFSMQSNLYKWLEDIEESQVGSGQIPCIVPTCGWGYEWGSGPAWDIALFEIIFSLYECKGDTYAAKRFLPVVEKYHTYLSSLSKDGLVEKGLGDWNYPKDINIKVAPLELISSCCYLRMTQIYAMMCDIAGRADDAKKLYGIAETIRQAIQAKFCGQDGSVANNEMTSLAAAVYFKVVSGAQKDKTIAKLIATIQDTGYCYHAGILGVKYINRVLCEAGRQDIFLRLMRRREYPSFYNWALQGATTLWEDFEGTNSRNHHMFGDISCVMMKYIAGLNVSITDGKRRLIISPSPQDLSSFSCFSDFGKGKVSITYKKTDGLCKFEIVIPGNTDAEFIYRNKKQILQEGRNYFEYSTQQQ